MAKTPNDLATRICIIAQRARQEGFEDVAAWMQRNLATDIRASRGKRRRGIKVKLLGGRVNAVLDEARVKELAEDTEQHDT